MASPPRSWCLRFRFDRADGLAIYVEKVVSKAIVLPHRRFTDGGAPASSKVEFFTVLYQATCRYRVSVNSQASFLFGYLRHMNSRRNKMQNIDNNTLFHRCTRRQTISVHGIGNTKINPMLCGFEPVGWVRMARRGIAGTFQGGKTGKERTCPGGRPKVLLRTYAVAFFAGFAVPCAAFLPFSFAANSCLTLAVIASVSTL